MTYIPVPVSDQIVGECRHCQGPLVESIGLDDHERDWPRLQHLLSCRACERDTPTGMSVELVGIRQAVAAYRRGERAPGRRRHAPA